MTYFRDSTESAYREYCAKIVGLQNRFSQHDRDRIVREFLSEGAQRQRSCPSLWSQWCASFVSMGWALHRGDSNHA